MQRVDVIKGHKIAPNNTHGTRTSAKLEAHNAAMAELFDRIVTRRRDSTTTAAAAAADESGERKTKTFSLDSRGIAERTQLRWGMGWVSEGGAR